MGQGNQPAWIQINRTAALGLVWQAQNWWWDDVGDKENDGTTNVHSILYDQNGKSAFGAAVTLRNGGATVLRTDKNAAGQADAMFPMSAQSDFDPTQGERGPYSLRVSGLGAAGSDIISGFGLIGNRHTQYWVIWKLVDQGAPVPPPSGDYVTRAEFEAFKQKLAAALG